MKRVYLGALLRSARLRRSLAAGQPLEWEIELRHCRQRHNWDCGLACVLMVLPDEKREDFAGNFRDICKNEGFNKSTWTIDLCFLLWRYNVHFKFFTAMLGVRSSFKQNKFYEKVFVKDEERVNRRFWDAAQLGFQLSQQHLSVEQIVSHLRIGPAIVLTNARLLTCGACKRSGTTGELRRCLSLVSFAYQGHYVVVCGYSVTRQLFYYRNPACDDHVCWTNFNAFEEARKSYGTDEDVILVYN